LVASFTKLEAYRYKAIILIDQTLL